MTIDKYNSILSDMKSSPKTWLVTGAAGFIGSNLVEFLLRNNQFVFGTLLPSIVNNIFHFSFKIVQIFDINEIYKEIVGNLEC